MRLNKLLASRGIGARRKCDALIQAGSVRVNGTVVKEPGTHVLPDRDRVEVHGRPIPGRAALRYVMVHKPIGVITTLDDPEGRPTVRALLPPGPRLFPVGRLDAETSGLIIATNDGELAHHLMHPRYGVRKVYRVRLDRPPDGDQIRRLRAGVEFEPRTVSAPCDVRVRNARPERAEIEIALHEGRYRQVRRMCEAVGLGVTRLHRPGYGPLQLGTLPRGAWRDLSPEEVRRLKAASARPVARVPRVRVAARSGKPSPVEATGPGEAAVREGRERAARPRVRRGLAPARARSAFRGSRSPSTLRPRPSLAAASPARRKTARPSTGGRRAFAAGSPARRGTARAPAGGRRPIAAGSPAGRRAARPPMAGGPRRAAGPPSRRRAAPVGSRGGFQGSRAGQRAGRGGPMRPGGPSGRGRASGGAPPRARQSARRASLRRPTTY